MANLLEYKLKKMLIFAQKILEVANVHDDELYYLVNSYLQMTLAFLIFIFEPTKVYQVDLFSERCGYTAKYPF